MDGAASRPSHPSPREGQGVGSAIDHAVVHREYAIHRKTLTVASLPQGDGLLYPSFRGGRQPDEGISFPQVDFHGVSPIFPACSDCLFKFC